MPEKAIDDYAGDEPIIKLAQSINNKNKPVELIVHEKLNNGHVIKLWGGWNE